MPEPVARAEIQRAHERVDLELEVTLEGEHNFYTGLTSNISEGGLFVATHALKPIGSRLAVRFRVPGAPEPIRAEGEVRWIRDTGSGDQSPGMGLRFLSLSATDLAHIQRFLETRDSLFFDD